MKTTSHHAQHTSELDYRPKDPAAVFCGPPSSSSPPESRPATSSGCGSSAGTPSSASRQGTRQAQRSEDEPSDTYRWEARDASRDEEEKGESNAFALPPPPFRWVSSLIPPSSLPPSAHQPPVPPLSYGPAPQSRDPLTARVGQPPLGNVRRQYRLGNVGKQRAKGNWNHSGWNVQCQPLRQGPCDPRQDERTLSRPKTNSNSSSSRLPPSAANSPALPLLQRLSPSFQPTAAPSLHTTPFPPPLYSQPTSFKASVPPTERGHEQLQLDELRRVALRSRKRTRENVGAE